LALELAIERTRNLQLEIDKNTEELRQKFQQEALKESEPAQKKEAEQVQIINEEVKKIKLANKWGEDVSWDFTKGQFVRTTPVAGAAAPPATGKPAK
jgi:hypothetical protein